VLAVLRGHLSFASDVCIYLLSVIITSLIGGFFPALGAAVAGSLLLNYYFAPPLHTFTIAGGNDVVSLVIFVLVAVLVSRVVDLAARRLVLAARASAEAETLSTLAGSLLRGEQALSALLERVQETFDLHSVSLLARDAEDPAPSNEGWRMLSSVGADPPKHPSQADSVARIDDRQLLAARGRTLHAADQRVLTAFAAQVAVAYRQRELAAAARAVEPLAESERVRTALLNAVGHDLRTPIAAAKAAVSSLRADDVSWSDTEHRELLETADDALDRLTDLVTNLLDLSRLQAGVLPVLAGPVGLDDVLARALDHALAGSGGRDPHANQAHVTVRIPPDLPEVIADAGLLERVLANLIQNALRYSPAESAITLTASAHFDRVELRIIDTGPGIDRHDAERVFEAFQRRNDSTSSGAGVGLGLAIARGFTEAMGGSVNAEQTPGGGATLVVSLPAVPRAKDEGGM
jgi:two-component system sensor histidine kinase KdpD